MIGARSWEGAGPRASIPRTARELKSAIVFTESAVHGNPGIGVSLNFNVSPKALVSTQDELRRTGTTEMVISGNCIIPINAPYP